MSPGLQSEIYWYFNIHICRYRYRFVSHSPFINSQFNYASVNWIFCRKKGYLKIEKKSNIKPLATSFV